MLSVEQAPGALWPSGRLATLDGGIESLVGLWAQALARTTQQMQHERPVGLAARSHERASGTLARTDMSTIVTTPPNSMPMPVTATLPHCLNRRCGYMT